ncbi:unnamed protein product [Diamesa serratosioi]
MSIVESFNRKAPKCARCKNHGLKIRLKGHKRYCKNRICICSKCSLTVDRQKLMALQTASKRAQNEDERRVLLAGEIPPPDNETIEQRMNVFNEKVIDITTMAPCQQPVIDQTQVAFQCNYQYPSTSMTAQPACYQYDNENIYKLALQFLKQMGYAYEVLPIFCALVKLANNNETVFFNAINEGISMTKDYEYT